MKYECESEGLRRISVALDPETCRILKELTETKKQPISQIVRSAITMVFESEIKGKNLPMEAWAELLSGGEHIILDVDMWSEMLDELETSEKFWEVVDREANRHGVYFKSIGLKNLEDILKHQQYKNWYRLKIKKKCCVLIPTSSSAMNLIIRFLDKVFEVVGVSAKFDKSSRSLMIIEEKSV